MASHKSKTYQTGEWGFRGRFDDEAEWPSFERNKEPIERIQRPASADSYRCPSNRYCNGSNGDARGDMPGNASGGMPRYGNVNVREHMTNGNVRGAAPRYHSGNARGGAPRCHNGFNGDAREDTSRYRNGSNQQVRFNNAGPQHSNWRSREGDKMNERWTNHRNSTFLGNGNGRRMSYAKKNSSQFEGNDVLLQQSRPIFSRNGRNANDQARSFQDGGGKWRDHNSSGANEASDSINQLSPREAEQQVAKDDEDGLSPAMESLHVNGKSSRDFQLMLYRRGVLVRENEDEGWPHIVGTCPDMCPAEEREKRARLRDLAVFERVNEDQGRTSKELAVKKFCRTFSGKDLKQSNVRPSPVLCHTMQHLMKILNMDQNPFELVHDFLFDRTRAIRQELSMQSITDKHAISINEIVVRFHIMSERELRQQRMSGKAFDSHLNLQQLSKALLSLLNLYIMHGNEDNELRNEAEFCCYYVLLNLGESQQLSLWFQSIRPSLLRTYDMQFARTVLRYYQQNNFQGFFRLATKATYLQGCLMELYFNEIRAFAINAINRGAYKLHPYPLRELSDLLLMEEDDMEEFCLLHGLAAGVSASNEVQLLVKQSEFSVPQQGVRQYHCQVMQEKWPSSFQAICSNSSLYPCTLSDNH